MNPYQEFLSCQQDFSYFCTKYLKILSPTRGIVPFELHDYQKKTIDIYDNYRYVILIKFRQGGFSTLTVLYALWKCMFKCNQSFGFVCKTENEASHLGKIVDKAFEFFPSWFVPPMEKNTKDVKKFSVTNSRMEFGSFSRFRGKPLTHLVVDEAAFIPDMEEKWKQMYPCIYSGGNVIVVSTTNGFDNWFYDTYNNAVEKKNDFFAYHPHYSEHPSYAKKEWVDAQRKQLGEKGWLQEVEGQFLCENNDFDIPYLNDLSDEDIWSMAIEMNLRLKTTDENKNIIKEMIRRLATK